MRGNESGTGDLAGMGLLLCGRHELYVSSLAALLSSRGVKVRVAESPGDIPERLPPGVDAVLLESPLPSELRRVAARGAPVLVLADRAAPDDALVAAQLGASALLDKNTSLAELVGALRRLSRTLPHGVDPLTPRQLEVLALIVEGLDNQAIATRLGITERTARSHVSSVLRGLGAGNRTQAAVLALQKGLVAWLALVLSLCALGQGAGASAAEPNGASALAPATERADARLALSMSSQMLRVGAASGAWVHDVDARRTLFQRRPTRARTPASTQKLLTSATALERLGPLFRFETTVLTAGEVVEGELAGNVYLKGAGDPSFGNSQLDQLADIVWEVGVDRIGGRVYGDESLFDSLRGGPASGFGVSPWVGPLSALSLNRGTLAPTGRGFQSEPPRFVAARLTAALRRQGVRVARKPRGGTASLAAKPIAVVGSPTLAALVRRMNLPSDNYYAEMLIKGLGARFGSSGSTAGGAAVVRRFAQGIGARARVVDGSGLSRANSIAPRALGRLLVRSYSRPWFDSLYRSLPVAGRSGTLRKRMRGGPAAGRCRAKTGTLIAVSALAGFCRSRSGHTLAFALLMNGVDVTVARSAQDRMAAALAAYRG